MKSGHPHEPAYITVYKYNSIGKDIKTLFRLASKVSRTATDI